jgi:hypothetical protein
VVAWVVVGWLAFGQSACTTLVPADAEAVFAAVEAGDRLSVLDSSGVTTDLVVETVGADFIEGTGEAGQPVRIAATHVAQIRRLAPGKTIALSAGAAFLSFMRALGASDWAGAWTF